MFFLFSDDLVVLLKKKKKKKKKEKSCWVLFGQILSVVTMWLFVLFCFVFGAFRH